MEVILYYNNYAGIYQSVTYALPDKEVTNENLVAEFPKWSVEKIANKVGSIKTHCIGKRNIGRSGG